MLPGLASWRKEGRAAAPTESVPLVLEPPVKHQHLMKTHLNQYSHLYITYLRDIDEDLALYYLNHDMSCELSKNGVRYPHRLVRI